MSIKNLILDLKIDVFFAFNFQENNFLKDDYYNENDILE